MNCIAAYDFGTSAVKAVLVDEEGKIRAIREKAYPLLKPKPLHVEQDPKDFWEAVCEVTKGVLADAQICPEEVKGLSFSVQAVTLIPVDSDGQVLCNAISWLDGRAEKQAEEINARVGAPVVRSQDYQSRILWIKENEPELYEKTAFFLECDGFLQYKCTGVMAVDRDYPGILKRHPAIQEYYDITLADVDREKLPPMVEACEQYGVLDEKGARELGLVPGIPVFGGMIDVPAAAAGCGCIKAGDAHIYLGSSGWLSALIDRPYETSEGVYQLNSITPGLMIYGGCTNSCCMMQNWVIDRFYAKEHETLGNGIFDYLAGEMEQVAPGCDELYAAPWLFGEQFPIADPRVRAIFFNIKEDHTRAHFMRAVLESLCFSMKGQIEIYKKDTGCTVTEVGANGGGAQSAFWMQLMADVLQMPVHVPEAARHSGAVGAALAAAIGLGWCKIENVSDFVRTEHSYYPHKELAALYEKKYERWQRLYECIRELSGEINEE